MHARSIALPALLALAACASAPRPPPGPFDHHLHVLSPELIADWKSLGVEFSKPDAAYSSAGPYLQGPQQLAGALLVPMAHLYANAEFRGALGLSLEQERARLRAENAYVIAQARAQFPRTLACVSIDPLRPYAVEEARHGLDVQGAFALNLHLASAGVDLTSPADLQAVAALLDVAGECGAPVLLHLDTQRRGLETSDVGAALEHWFGPRPQLVVIIAHLGGSGGFGPWTRSVLDTAVRWLADESAAGREHPGVRFDISAVMLERESEGVPATTPEEAALLAPALRRAGLGRVLFASDAPVFDPADTARLWRERSALAPDEWARVLANRP